MQRLPKARKNERTGHWEIRLELPRHPLTGKRRRKVISGKTKTLVQERARTFLNDQLQGLKPGSETTLAAYLLQWFDSMTATWSVRTQEIYIGLIKNHIIPNLGTLLLADITPIHIRKMLSTLAAKGIRSTANKCRTLLYTALEHATESDLIRKNPVKPVKPVKESPKDVPVLEPHEMRRLLDSFYGHRLFPAFYLLVAAGLRRGELLGLAWSDLKPNGLHLHRQLKYEDGKAVLGELKTKNGKRFVALAPDAIEMLESHREKQQQERETCGASWHESDLIFTTATGTHVDPRNLLRTVKHQAKKLGLKDTNLHAFRHLHATQLLMHELDVKSISSRLGHSSTSFTMDVYGHVLQQHQSRTALSVGRILGDEAEEHNDPQTNS